jgi:hypothetical protein
MPIITAIVFIIFLIVMVSLFLEWLDSENDT